MGQKNSKFMNVTAGKICVLIATLIFFGLPCTGLCQEDLPRMVMTHAVMCESIESFKPVSPAVVFSISLGEVFCYSSFDPVYETTRIYHKWYKRDKLIFTMRLTLSPPKWASFSRIQIRDADKGPWRVQIEDDKAKVLQTLRFSMAD